MKIKDLFETEQEMNIKITNDDLDSNGRLKKQYEDSVINDFLCYKTDITSLEGAPKSVSGNFFCSVSKITSLEGASQSVGKTFDCSNTKITSLKGAPISVGGSFYCQNTKIASLEGAPKYVDVSFYCYDTRITSLKGIGKDFLLEVNGTIDLNNCFQLSGGFLSLLKVKGLKKIKFNVNKEVENIFNRHLSGDRDLLDCKEELMNAGFKEFAKL